MSDLTARLNKLERTQVVLVWTTLMLGVGVLGLSGAIHYITATIRMLH